MQRQVLASLFMYAASACSAASAQVTFLGSHGGHDYYTSNAMDIGAARVLAASLNGYLVAVNDQAENDFLVAATGGATRSWIGLSDEVTEGVWLWDSGEPFSYSNWAEGEPNDYRVYDPNGEDYVTMNWFSPGRWNDLHGWSTDERPIIEVALPAPAGTKHVAPCGDNTWTGASDVCAAPDGPKRTIQAAIDAAAHRDTILVAAGTYHEAINFNGKGVYLHSAAGPELTIIDATGLFASVVTCASGETPNTILEGFTITGGNGQLDPGGYGIVGGGMYNVLSSSPTVTNCWFIGNSAGDLVSPFCDGGGMYNAWSCNPNLTNCTFRDNSAYYGGAIFNFDHSSPTVTGCTFTGNRAVVGGAITNGGGCNPTVTNCTLTANSASDVAGGIVNIEANPTVTNCTFSGNSASYQGGGMLSINSSPTVTNCTFSGNSSFHGGGMINLDNSNPAVTNCTFSGNSADDGGGIFSDSSSPTVTNCIFWGNGGGSVVGISHVTHSDVQGGYAGAGNINANPHFARDPSSGPDGRWGTDDDDYGDLRVTAGSSCIDAADNTAVPGGVTIDLDGNSRFHNDPWTNDTGVSGGAGGTRIVDMGAYEFQGNSCPAEFNNDGLLNSQDFFDFLGAFFANDPAADVNDDGVTNSQDFFDFLAAFFTGCA